MAAAMHGPAAFSTAYPAANFLGLLAGAELLFSTAYPAANSNDIPYFCSKIFSTAYPAANWMTFLNSPK